MPKKKISIKKLLKIYSVKFSMSMGSKFLRYLQPFLIWLGIYSIASFSVSAYLTSSLLGLFGIGSIFHLPMIAGLSSAISGYMTTMV